MKPSRTIVKTPCSLAEGKSSRAASYRNSGDPIAVALLALAVAVAVLIAHYPVLSAKAASFDDEEAIVNNRLVQNPSFYSVKRFFGEVFLSSVVRGYYRPLTLTSLMLDWAMGGRPDNPRVFHRTSLTLHIGSTVLLVLLCYQLFKKPWIAAAVGLIFGVHPLTVEPIAWMMERKTVLAGLFAFAAFNAHVRFARTGAARWYVAALVMFLGALLSKPTATPLPLMMLLIDYWPLKRYSRRAIAEKIPFLALSVLFAVLTCVCEERVNPLTLPVATSLLHLPLRICWLTVFYPCKILLPIRLSSAYVLPDPLALTNPIVIAAVAGAILLIAAVAFSARRTPAIWVGTAIFYLGLAPTMGFVGYSWVVASDKYTYLPAVGLVLILGWILERIDQGIGGGTRRIRLGVTGGLVLIVAGLLTTGTRGYLRHWQTTMELYDYLLAPGPNIAELHNNHAIACDQVGDNARAIRGFTKAIELSPEYTNAYYNRGTIYLKMGKHFPAVLDFTKAIELKPEHADAHCNRAIAHYYLKEYDKAWADVIICRRLGLAPHPDFISNLTQATAGGEQNGDKLRPSLP